MTDKIIEILKKNVVSFNNHDVIFGGDGDLTDLANELEEAINYTHCCKTLNEGNYEHVLTFKEGKLISDKFIKIE